MCDNEFETRNIKFKPIMKLNHNIYIILAVVIGSDQEIISLRVKALLFERASPERASEGSRRPNLSHRRSGCQLGLLSINFVFRNVIFQPMVFPFVSAKYKWNFMRDRCKLSFPLASAPRGFATHSRVFARLASLAQIGELARRLRKNLLFSLALWCVESVKESNKPISNYCIHRIFSNEPPRSNKHLACSQTLCFLFKVGQDRLVIEYKQKAIYWPPAQGGSVGEEENRRARSRARLRAVPQDGHTSEEIERSERKPRGSWERGGKGGRERTLLLASLQFPSRPTRSLQSCRA